VILLLAPLTDRAGDASMRFLAALLIATVCAGLGARWSR
jgi:hypothetical protein